MPKRRLSRGPCAFIHRMPVLHDGRGSGRFGAGHLPGPVAHLSNLQNVKATRKSRIFPRWRIDSHFAGSLVGLQKPTRTSGRDRQRPHNVSTRSPTSPKTARLAKHLARVFKNAKQPTKRIQWGRRRRSHNDEHRRPGGLGFADGVVRIPRAHRRRKVVILDTDTSFRGSHLVCTVSCRAQSHSHGLVGQPSPWFNSAAEALRMAMGTRSCRPAHDLAAARRGLIQLPPRYVWPDPGWSICLSPTPVHLFRGLQSGTDRYEWFDPCKG